MNDPNEVEILLVEDNPNDAELTLRALKKNRLANQVVVVTDGEEALDFIFARGAYHYRKVGNGPKVILLDLKLPKVDGMELLKIVKGDPRTKIIPVVVLTSSKEESDIVESYALGVNSYIVKPVDFDKFIDAVNALGLYWLLLNEIANPIKAPNMAMEAPPTIRILFVEDLPSDMELAERAFRKDGLLFTSTRVDTKEAFLDALMEFQPDIVISDYALPEFDGMQALKLSQGCDPALPFIVLTGSMNEDTAVACMKAGASDYVIKEHITRLPFSVREALEQRITRTMKDEAERAQRDSEARFRRLAENAQDMILRYEYTPRRGFTYVSPAATAITGYTPEEYYADPDLDLKIVHPEDRPLLEAAARGKTAAGTSLALRWVRKDGALIWTEQRTVAILDDTGNLVAIEAIVRDITERKQAEIALRESEERYRLIADHVGDIVWQLDMGLRFVYLSPAVERVLGYRVEEALGVHVTNFLNEEGMAQMKEVIQSRLENPNSTNEPTEYKMRHKDGSWVNVEVASSPLFDEDGHAIGFAGITRDITERKQAEEALKNSEKRFRALIENGLDNISLVDANGALLWESPAVIRTLGYSQGEFVGQNTFELMHPDDVEWTRKLLGRLIREPGSRQHGSFRLRHIDGSWRWVEAVVTNLLDEPSVKAIVINYRDISERRQAEEALRNSEQRYRALFEDTPVPIWEQDFSQLKEHLESLKRQGVTDFKAYFASHPEAVFECARMIRITDTNNAAVQMYRAESKEDLIQSTSQGLSSGELDHLHEDFTAIAEGKTSHSWEGADQTLTGDPIAISLSWSVAPGHEHDFSKVMVITQDITERKRAAEDLKKQKEILQMIFDHIPVMINFTGEDGHIKLVNRAWEHTLGWSLEEIQRKSLDIYTELYPDPQYRQEVMNFIYTAQMDWGDFKTNVRDGRVIDTTWAEIKLSDGTTIGIGQDITERKQAEDALKNSEERFRRYFELGLIGMAITSPDKGFIEANDQICQVLGYERSELVRMTWAEITHPDDLAIDEGNFNRVLAGEIHGYSMDKRWIRKDGQVIYSTISVKCIRGEDGSVDYFVSLVQDITERKQNEDILNQRLAELEAVHTVSGALRMAQSLDEALPILLDQTLAALDTKAGIIWLYHAESDKLHAEVARGWFHQLDLTPISPGLGIPGTVFASGMPHLSPEFAQDALVRPSSRPLIPNGWGGACVPIRIGEQTVGVIFVSVPLPRQITPEQMSVLASLAEIAGNTIHRMRLHEETVRRLENLQALHAVDQAMNASLDLRLSLNVLLEQASTRLGVDASSVLLFNSDLQTLEFVARHGFKARLDKNVHLRLDGSLAGKAILERRTISMADIDARLLNDSRASLVNLRSEGFVTYFAVPLLAKGETKGVLEVFHRTPIDPNPEWLDFLETLAGQAAIAVDNSQLFEHLQHANLELSLAYDATIEGWSHALDLRDKETEGHTQRVTEITQQLGRAFGLSGEQLLHIRRGSLLHDIGKLGVPDYILLKPGPLTDEEWVTMKKHPVYAYEMLSPIAYLRPALDIPYSHHEKWDGAGYPRGLKGEQIPLAARIFAVVDVWDALISDRPYRKAWTETKALDYLREQRGKHFDPQVVDEFIRLLDRIR